MAIVRDDYLGKSGGKYTGYTSPSRPVHGGKGGSFAAPEVSPGSGGPQGLPSVNQLQSFNAQSLFEIQRYNNALAQANAQAQMQFQVEEARKSREWQEMMSNTAHQREVADLKAAGLNPILSAGGSGATTPATSIPTGSQAQVDTSLISALAAIVSSSMNSAAMLQAANINAEASRYASDRSPYGSLQSVISNLAKGFDVNNPFSSDYWDNQKKPIQYLKKLNSYQFNSSGKYNFVKG